jgi:hypothetical protein
MDFGRRGSANGKALSFLWGRSEFIHCRFVGIGTVNKRVPGFSSPLTSTYREEVKDPMRVSKVPVNG